MRTVGIKVLKNKLSEYVRATELMNLSEFGVWVECRRG
jgi:hypothetical protein